MGFFRPYIQTEAQAARNEQEFETKKEEIRPHLEQSRAALLEGVSKNLQEIIVNLEELSIDDNLDIQGQLQESINELKNLYAELQSITEYVEISDLLKKCNSVLEDIKEVITAVQSDSIKEKFENLFSEFHKLAHEAPNHVEQFIDNSFKSPNLYYPSLEEKKPSLPDSVLLQQPVIFNSEFEHKLEPLLQSVNEDKIVPQADMGNLENLPLALAEDAFVNSPNFQNLGGKENATKFFKHMNSEIKNQCSKDSIKLVEPENQSNYQKSIEGMLECIEALKYICSDSDDLIKVERLEILLNKAVSLGYDQVNELEIKEIRTLAMDLEENHEEIQTPREILDTSLNFFPNPSPNII